MQKITVKELIPGDQFKTKISSPEWHEFIDSVPADDKMPGFVLLKTVMCGMKAQVYKHKDALVVKRNKIGRLNHDQ